MTFRMQSQTNPKFKDVALKLGNVSFGKRNIGLFKNFGDSIRPETINSPIEKLIGTIAPDLFENRILVIDYPHKRLCVVDELPRKMKKATFQDMKIQEGRIKIPFSVGDSTYDVMFDTGSSIFDMMTDAENLKKCTLPNTPISDSLKISSWGNFFYVYSMPFNKPFRFGKKSFLNAKVYFSKGADELNFNREEKILGITGNALFLNNTVIIDYKRKKFGVL